MYLPMKALFLAVLLLLQSPIYGMGKKLDWDKAIDQAVRRYGLKYEPEIQNWFKQANVSYPPKKIALLAFKSERKIHLWAKDNKNQWKDIHQFPLTAYSGKLGPKLKEHDLQIPEGIYKLSSFNPFSSFHLSLMVNYPNRYDKIKGIKDHRKKLGNNIFIHGSNLSAGCLAIGNKGIDQLFLLVRRTGLSNVKLIIAPNDLRCRKPATPSIGQPNWLPQLYANINQALKPYGHC